MLSIFLVSLLSNVVPLLACAEHHGHVQRNRPSLRLTPPTRPLEWGDINVIHTTDTHGWLLGHQKGPFPEPNYSADFGQFASFVKHMKRLAKRKGVDLLLVDSGDMHDGSGIADGFPPGGVYGHDANEFVKQLPYDVLAIGNHELYEYSVALDVHTNFAPAFKGRYLTSNVNITYADWNNTVNTPLGSRSAKFITAKGRKVTALGVLYNFSAFAKNTTVQTIEDMVREPWFAEAIKDEPDLFLLAGHMPVANDRWPVVFNAVRAVHPRTPIIILGGHTHIRDCLQLDGRSMSLASGRYMETVGWLSVKLDQKESTNNLTFSRRYLDTNRLTYEYHAGLKGNAFDTKEGRSITHGLQELAERFNISFTFGFAPDDFTLLQAPYPSSDSVLSLYINEVLPVALAVNNPRASIPHIIVVSGGSLRFDLFKGPFTRDDQFKINPFLNTFVFVENVPFSVASMMLDALNSPHSVRARKREEHAYGRGDVATIFSNWMGDMSMVERKRECGELTLGYTTKDSCPGTGDDTLHTPLKLYSTPPFIGTKLTPLAPETPVDLVSIDFIMNEVLEVLNDVAKNTGKRYGAGDVKPYSDVLSNEVWGVYAQRAWAHAR